MAQIKSLKKLAISGSLWIFFGFGAQQVLRFAGNIILTRLLEPELFGLMALITSIRIGLELFSDIGLGHNIIQSDRSRDPEFYNTAWTLQVIRGFILWGMSLLLAMPIANFYEEDRLLLLLPIIGFTTVLDGFTSTSELFLRKELKTGLITLNIICLRALSLLIMIAWASVSPTVWALAIGSLCFAGFRIISTHFILPGPANRFCWDQSSIKEIYNFGKWIFFSTMLFFLADQADRFILPKLFSFDLLGVYTIAYTLANLPRQVLQRIGGQVIFPAFTKRKTLPRSELKEKISMPRGKFLLFAALGMSILLAFGDLAITVLYDSRYENAVWMFPILCLGVWFSMLLSISVNALLAFGKPAYLAYAHASKLLIIFPGMYLANQLLGIVAVVVVISLSDLFAYLGIQYGLYIENIIFPKQDLIMTLLFMLFTSFFFLIRWLSGWGFPFNGLTESF